MEAQDDPVQLILSQDLLSHIVAEAEAELIGPAHQEVQVDQVAAAQEHAQDNKVQMALVGAAEVAQDLTHLMKVEMAVTDSLF